MVTFKADSFEARNINAALGAADVTWTAEWRGVHYDNPAAFGGIEATGEVRALVRSDNGRPLGFHGGSYEPVQPVQAFTGIQPLLDSGAARIRSILSLDGGRKLAVECDIGSLERAVKVGDIVSRRVVFGNSYDGTTKCTVSFDTRRLACTNGMCKLERALAFGGRHTSGIHIKLDRFAVALAEQREVLEAQAKVWAAFAERRMNERALTAYVREVLSEGAGSDDSIKVKGVDRIVELAHTAPGADPGTLWGGFNAVTYWATHERGRSDDARSVSNLFGKGGELIERAQQVATLVAERLPYVEMGRAASNAHATASLEFGSLLGRRSVVLDQADAE